MSLTGLRPLARQSTESLVACSLRRYILSGELTLGERLTETALAERLGVARATLRTALHRLTSEGIVVQVPYTGWHVVSFSAADIWEIWTLRGSLESLAARLAAGRTEARAELAAAYEALLHACDAGDVTAMSEADFALHRAIIEASGHGRLAAQYQIVERQVRLYIATSNRHVATGPADIVAQHRPLAEALAAGDADGAARAAWLHNESEGRRLTEWLGQQPQA